MDVERIIKETISEAIREAAKIGAEAGARAALDAVERQKETAYRARYDRRLRNTKLLLKHYRAMKDSAGERISAAVQMAASSDEDIERLMSDLSEDDFHVESIKRAAGRTAILVGHLDKMLAIYECYCQKSNREDYKRNFRVLKAMYIDEIPTTAEAVARVEQIDKRTVYKDIDAAVETLTTLIFGIDGIKR